MTSPTGAPIEDVDQYCYRHPDRVTGVRCVRCDRPICPDCMRPASVGFQCPECVSEGQKNVRQARTIYGGQVRRGAEANLVTRVLIGINVIVFIATTASGVNVLTGSGNSKLFTKFALIPPAVAHGEWWRLFTAAFLHFGIFHIGFNMYALWIFGPPLEAMLGRLRFGSLYVLAGLGGSILSVALGPLDETAAGASGAIFGLFAALYLIARHQKINAQGIAVTIVANLVFTFAISNIDWRGHVGGLIVGAAVAAALAYAPKGPRRAQIQAAGVGAIAIVLAALGLLAVHHTNGRCRSAAEHAQSTDTVTADYAYCATYDPSAVQSQSSGV